MIVIATRNAHKVAEIRALQAQARIDESGLRLTTASAALGPDGRLSAAGRLTWSAPVEGEFRIEGDGLTLAPPLFDALPPTAARLLRRLEPAGTVRLALERLILPELGHLAGEAIKTR